MRGHLDVESAAERADEIDGECELARLQFGAQLPLLEHLRLDRDEGEQAAEPGLVARERQAIRLLRRGERGIGFGALRLHRAHRGELVDDFAQRIREGLVVLLDRRVVFRVAHGERAAQPAALQDRQADRRAGGGNPAAGREQLRQRHRLHADEGGEIDVGIELGLGGGDVARRRLGAPAARHDVGTASQQVRRHARGQRDACHPQRRALDGETAIGSFAEERGKLVAR